MTASTDNLTVRVAHEGDLSAIAGLRRLWAGELTDEPGFDGRLAAWFTATRERRTTWLAFARCNAVGMVTLTEYQRMPRPGQPDSRWGYVGHMFVRENARNRGIGAMLLAALISAADQRGYVRLVLSPTSRAVPFFQRAGFATAGEDATALLLVRGGAANSRGARI